MARTAAAGIGSRVRARARSAQLCRGGRALLAAGAAWLAAGLLLIGLTSPALCQSEPVKGEATLVVSGGYARMVIKLADDVDTQVSTAGSIIVIRFKRPVDVAVEKLSDAAPDYIGTVRRDPDGSGIRMALKRRGVRSSRVGTRAGAVSRKRSMSRSSLRPSARRLA